MMKFFSYCHTNNEGSAEDAWNPRELKCIVNLSNQAYGACFSPYRLIQMTYKVQVLVVHKHLGLMHVNLFFELSIEKHIVYVKLSYWPVKANCKIENNEYCVVG